jgi:hypothetical protein
LFEISGAAPFYAVTPTSSNRNAPSRKLSSLAYDGPAAVLAAGERVGQAASERGALVELGFEVLEVQCEVEDCRVTRRAAGGRRRGWRRLVVRGTGLGDSIKHRRTDNTEAGYSGGFEKYAPVGFALCASGN